MAVAKSQDNLRIVMIGKTGVGKSATGNTILGFKSFHSEARATSITKTCSSGSEIRNDKKLLVVDTPGLYDTNLSNNEVINEVVKCIKLAAPGPHVFLLVISIGRFTEEEKKTVQLIQNVFGKDAHKYMMVLFTRAGELDEDQTLDDYIHESTDLTELINACNGRYHAFNNRDKSNHTQVDQFMMKIEDMLRQNQNSYYNYYMFTMANELKDTKKTMQEKDTIINDLECKVRELHKQMEQSACCII